MSIPLYTLVTVAFYYNAQIIILEKLNKQQRLEINFHTTSVVKNMKESIVFIFFNRDSRIH